MGIFDSIGSLFGADSILGVQAFSNPGNVRAQDGNLSSALLLLGQQSNYLKVTGFGFSVPMDSVVTGVKVTVVRQSSINLGVQDASLRLYKAGVLTGDDKSTGLAWTSSLTTVEYGADMDNWGWGAMTPSDINNPGFGVGLSALATIAGTASVDWVNVTVYYRGSNGSFSTSMHDFQSSDGISNSGSVN